jgi:hypothetical protein
MAPDRYYHGIPVESFNRGLGAGGLTVCAGICVGLIVVGIVKARRDTQRLRDFENEQKPEPASMAKPTQSDMISEPLWLKHDSEAAQMDAPMPKEAPLSVSSPEGIVSGAAEPVKTTRKIPLPRSKGNYGFACVYAALCFIGTGIDLYLLLTSATAQEFGHTVAAPTLMNRVSLTFQAVLWLATGLCLLARSKWSIPLVYIGAVTGGLGVLLRGIFPLDLLIYIPCLAMVFYIRKRRSLLN